MTLPRKGRRTIWVNDQQYHWVAKSTVRHKDDHFFTEARLTIERVDHPRRQVQALFDSRALFEPSWRRKYVDYLAITPGVVRAVIVWVQSQSETDLEESGKSLIPNASLLFKDALTEALTSGSRWGDDVEGLHPTDDGSRRP
ncbi:MAG: hypothetical protein ACLFU8_17060 [Anaerolineales bacterium]